MPTAVLSVLLCWILGTTTLIGAEMALIPQQNGVHDVVLTPLADGEWEVRTTGSDPYLFVTAGHTIDLAQAPTLAFDYFSTTGIGRLLVFVGEQLDIPHLITQSGLGRREGWSPTAIDLTGTPQPPTMPVTSLRLTFGEQPGLIIRLRGLRVRPATVQEMHQKADREERIQHDRAHADRLQRYLTSAPQAVITRVAVNGPQIHIDGNLGGLSGDLALAAVPMWADVTALASPTTLLPLTPNTDGSFHCHTERMASDGVDLLLTGWCVVRREDQRYVPISALHYADHLTPRADLPPAKPRSRKGLGGCPFSHPDMDELGIASVTLNIILNDLLHADAGPGRQPYVYAGRTWYSDDAALARYDEQMLIAARHDWMVSAIILLSPAHDAPAGSWIRDAAHPDADPSGIFVMPNLTSRVGVEAYAAAMNLIAERYSRADGRYGRIHHWIMHNEIPNGFYWTTAGSKTVMTYLDLYQKSMRIAWLLTNQYDANAKPLISLDHCWNAVPDPRGYAGHDLLDLLVRFSRVEGDFPWGIAFHPYAQDITNPRTWEDRDATFSVDTPFLTFRNLEVLDAWCRQPSVAYLEKFPREVQLTEQGLNSPDYSKQSMNDQAAGLAYAWAKIDGLSTITAFQYHLWADDHGEGGLRLGLRRYSDDAQDPHGRKPSWHLFQAMGSDAWDAASAFAKPILGIHDWSEVHFRGTITGIPTPAGSP